MNETIDEEKKKSYDSDEDEANPLVIEEEDYSMQPEDLQSENDEFGIKKTNSIIKIVCFDVFEILYLMKSDVITSCILKYFSL